MDDSRIQAVLDRTDASLKNYAEGVTAQSLGLRARVRSAAMSLQEEVSVRITSCETCLTRAVALIAQDAEYHVLSAYYHASPALIAIILGIYGVIQVFIGIINTINGILQVVTGETLAYWLDKLLPGFQEAWNDIMNRISEFSAALGWGVDGVNHMLNIVNTSADMWGLVTGKERETVKVEKYKRTERLMNNYSLALQRWQQNPGQQIASWADSAAVWRWPEGVSIMHNITDKLGEFGTKAEEAITGLGTISSEFLALRNDMPAFIAKNIPSGIWDGIERVDTTINDRILPALTNITDRIEELDAVLESYRAKAEALADKIAHPGDLLSEIDKLPGYARAEQLVKIDEVTSTLLREKNEADFAAMEGDLREFAAVAEALTHAPAPLAFMELELPGRSPGIVAEPRETWFVGDY